MPPIIGLTAFVLAFVASTAAAQDSSVPPAHISFVEGVATLERNGDVEPVALNMPVVEGDRVRTANGRLQIAFPDGSAVDLDTNSEVEYLGAARVRVYAGTVENRPAVALRSSSAPYLPADSQQYAPDLDQNGSWQYDTTYGNVWYPTVAADWRPYYYGYWTSVPAYGWTWIGYNRWAWPTHHYGRWGYGHDRWFWIPGRTYASAWVSWGTAPGYVSWCPLGFDSRPVAALSVGYSRGWNAWTVVPRDHFGWRGYPAHRYAVEPSRIAASTPFIVHREQPASSVRGAGSYVSAPRSGAYASPRSSASSLARPGSFNSRVERVPSTSSPAPRVMPGATRDGNGRAYQPPVRSSSPPAPSYQRSAPSYSSARPSATAPAPSRPSYERPSYQPPAATAPRASGGGGHPGNAPHADRAPSGGSRGGSSQNGGSHGGGSHGGGSHGGGSHGSSSQGTAVRRSR